MHPKSGFLGPHEQIALEFTFSPFHSKGTTGFISGSSNSISITGFVEITCGNLSTYKILYRLIFSDGKDLFDIRKLKFPFIATCEPLTVCLKLEPPLASTRSSENIDFGSCAVQESSTKRFILMNTSSSLPVNFKFSKVAHFSMEPFQGIIDSKCSQIILIRFTPRHLGIIFFDKYKRFLGHITCQTKLTIIGRTSKVLKIKLIKLIGNGTQFPDSTSKNTLTGFVDFDVLLDEENPTQ